MINKMMIFVTEIFTLNDGLHLGFFTQVLLLTASMLSGLSKEKVDFSCFQAAQRD